MTTMSNTTSSIETHITSMNGARITATHMIIEPIDCDEPCNAIVTVTWKNIGNGPGKFKPAIKIDDTRIRLDEEINLAKDQTTTQIFNVTNLMEGIYTVCPIPN